MHAAAIYGRGADVSGGAGEGEEGAIAHPWLITESEDSPTWGARAGYNSPPYAATHFPGHVRYGAMDKRY
eukprot:3034666-Rhodomonas_salina.1